VTLTSFLSTGQGTDNVRYPTHVRRKEESRNHVIRSDHHRRFHIKPIHTRIQLLQLQQYVITNKPLPNFLLEPLTNTERNLCIPRAGVREPDRSGQQRPQQPTAREERCVDISNNIQLTRRQAFLSTEIDMVDPLIRCVIQCSDT
jgi:hypothetical protein